MNYYQVSTNKRLTYAEIMSIGIDISKSLEEQGIYVLYTDYPEKYVTYSNLYNIADNGTEYFEETRTITNPLKLLPGNENDTTIVDTITTLVKGYRIKWTLTAKDKDTIKPILFDMLTVKKHEVEDAGATLSNGLVIQTAESDRARIMSMGLGYVYTRIINTSDTEFIEALNSNEFKRDNGDFIYLSESDFWVIFRTVGLRTIKVFKREAAITTLITTAYNNNDADGMLTAYFNNIDTGWE